MTNKDALIRDAAKELQRAEDAVKRARQRLEEINNLPEEPDNLSIIRFSLCFNSYSSPYEYVALRVAGWWYVTGNDHHKVRYNWVELVKWIRSVHAVRSMYLVNGDVSRAIGGF